MDASFFVYLFGAGALFPAVSPLKFDEKYLKPRERVL